MSIENAYLSKPTREGCYVHKKMATCVIITQQVTMGEVGYFDSKCVPYRKTPTNHLAH